MIAREGLHGQMNPLMALQIMIAIEALGALVTLEWSIMGWWLLRCVCPWLTVHRLWIGRKTTVECHGKHAMIHVSHHCHLCTWTVDIGHDRPGHSG